MNYIFAICIVKKLENYCSNQNLNLLPLIFAGVASTVRETHSAVVGGVD
jgi:hypothetical protein